MPMHSSFKLRLVLSACLAIAALTPGIAAQSGATELAVVRAVATPALGFPADRATGVALILNLTWGASPGATSYNVYFGTQQTPPLVKTVTGTSYSPGTLEISTTYYWRVVATDGAGTATSATRSFTTRAALAAPVLLWPQNGAKDVTPAPTLTWSASPGATMYDVYFGTSPAPPQVASTSYTGYSPYVSLSGGYPLDWSTTYYWRVVARDSAGNVSSATWSFTTQSSSGPPPWPPYVWSITNSASYAASGTNGYGIAQGSVFVLFGGNLGPAALQQAGAFPLPSKLGGTEVIISVAGTTVKAPLIYSSSGQVAGLLPSSVPIGEGTLQLNTDRFPGTPVPIRVAKAAVGIYAVSGNGIGAGTITGADYRLKTYSEPARIGDMLILWGTGLGAVEGNESNGALPGNRFADVDVLVGGVRAPVAYAGRSGCCAGLDQIVFTVPSTVRGCFVPVAVRYGGVTSNFVTLPIADAGQSCRDAVGIPPALLETAASGGELQIGAIALGPMRILHGAGFSYYHSVASELSSLMKTKVSASEVMALARSSGAERTRSLRAAVDKYGPLLRARGLKARDVMRKVSRLDEQGIGASFTKLSGLSAVTSLFGSMLPPPGTCTVVRDWRFRSPDWGSRGSARDAGPDLVLTGPLGTHVLTRVASGEYLQSLGSVLTFGLMPAGTYAVTGKGGGDIGAFEASLRANGMQWTNKDDISSVDRSKPLRVTWAGVAETGYVLFGGTATESDLKTAFACVAPASARELTVPEYVLSAMPASKEDKGSLFLSGHPLQNSFTAKGVDFGYFADFGSEAKDVTFR